MARHIAMRPEFGNSARTTWDDPLFWNAADSAQNRSQLFAIGNSINFRFWSLDGDRMVPATGTIDGRDYRGAMYMWRSLRRSLDQSDLPVLDASFLADLSRNDFDEIFTDDRGINPLSIALEDRLSNIRDLGARLISDWGGSFLNLACASRGSLVEFARLSRSFRAFDDPLFKLTMVNAIMHGGSSVYEFRDDALPAIDYHLLRHAVRQGILRPRSPVASKLMRSALLEAQEAYELRRVALMAFVELSDLSGISGQILDNKYWMNRINCTDMDPVCLQDATAQQCPFLDACARATEFALPLELTRYY
jgi:hypothetical protein